MLRVELPARRDIRCPICLETKMALERAYAVCEGTEECVTYIARCESCGHLVTRLDHRLSLTKILEHVVYRDIALQSGTPFLCSPPCPSGDD